MGTYKTARNYKRAVICEEYIAITGDMMEAVILNQMIYWSKHIRDFDQFVKEEQERRKRDGKNAGDISMSYGWIYKAAAELKEEIMSTDSPKTIGRKLDSLVQKGFLDRRNNPNSRYDHKYQYRVNYVVLTDALHAAGYFPQGFIVEDAEDEDFPAAQEDAGNVESKGQIVPAPAAEKPSEGQNDFTNGQNVPSKGQIVPSMGQDVAPKGHGVPSEGHGVQTIPEIITETTTEITSSSPSIPHTAPRRMDKRSLEDLFEKIGIADSPYCDMLKPVISDLWTSRRVGATTRTRAEIEKALSALSAEMLSEVVEKYTRQQKKGGISMPGEYLKALILREPQEAALRNALKGKGQAPEQAPSYDIDEYIRLSLAKLNG